MDTVKSSFRAQKKADHISMAIGNVLSHLPSDLGRRSVFYRLIFRNHSHGHAKNTPFPEEIMHLPLRGQFGP